MKKSFALACLIATAQAINLSDSNTLTPSDEAKEGIQQMECGECKSSSQEQQNVLKDK